MEAQRLEDRDLLSEINAEFLGKCGPMLSGDDLWQALRFESLEDYEAARSQDALPVPVYPIDGGSGEFAYSWDVACWLVRVGPISSAG